MQRKKQKISIIIVIAVLILGLLCSIGLNIYFEVCYMKSESYLQSPDEIYIMEAGILRNNLKFHDGTDYELQYDFSHENYQTLKNKYHVEQTAKSGTQFERALRLMNEYAPRLTHKGDYDNHIPINALELLEYSLNNKNHGINCRNKAQILNEMCLSLGIYARKVWIMPYSRYDNDCHVVNEIWDSSLEKWIMLDITNNTYWVDENKTPLSVLEIRQKAAMREFCTPVEVGDDTKNLQKLKEKNLGNFLYIVKNMVYMEYCTQYTVGESKEFYLLLPQNVPTNDYGLIISESSLHRSPVK